MNLDDRLRNAGERLSLKLEKVRVPTAPQTGLQLWRPVVATAVVVLIIGGSLFWMSRSDRTGGDVAEVTTSTLSTQIDGEGSLDALPVCGSLVWPTAPEDWYREKPVYNDGDLQEFVEEVERFASTLPGFERIWVDRSHNLWVTVGFVGVNTVERQTQLEDAYPGAGVVAVEMAYTSAELEALSDELAPELPEGMTSYDIYETAGFVGVWVGVITPERISELVGVAGDRPVCWDGYQPDEIVADGPQVSGGDGWRYVGEYNFGIGRAPRIAASDVALSDLWTELALTDPMPEVDFVSEILVMFEIGLSGNCTDSRLDGIEVIDNVVQPVVVDPTTGTGPPQACFLNYMPRIYVVALSRDVLPAPPFAIRTGPNPAFETTIAADLRQSGSDLEP